MLSRTLAVPSKSLSTIVRQLSSAMSTAAAVNAEEDVLFAEYGRKGVITLNRPKQLNALSHPMVLKIYPKLREWDTVKDLIVMRGTEKSFSSGGDLAALSESATTEIHEQRAGYHLLYHIEGALASLKTPYLAIIHGIVMGGGVGLSIHGNYRLATETSMFAMPETQIGLFPDVGVTYFLSRMPGSLGMFLALTGYRLKGFDLVHAGIATHFCQSTMLADFEAEVFKPETKAEAVLAKFHASSIEKLPNGKIVPFSLQPHSDTINSCFSADSVEEIVSRLQETNTDFTKGVLSLLKATSPMSLKVTYEQIKRAAKLDVYEVLNMDFRLGWKMLSANDFIEGVRALLVDKDKTPKWQHKRIEDVTDAEVKKYFELLDKNDELNLPQSMLKPSL